MSGGLVANVSPPSTAIITAKHTVQHWVVQGAFKRMHELYAEQTLRGHHRSTQQGVEPCTFAAHLSAAPRAPTGQFCVTSSFLFVAAGRRGRPVPHKVVVDVREFMSGLPAVLHTQGFKLTPTTLEVS